MMATYVPKTRESSMVQHIQWKHDSPKLSFEVLNVFHVRMVEIEKLCENVKIRFQY